MHKRCALMMWPPVGVCMYRSSFSFVHFPLSYFIFFLFSAFFFLMYRLSSRGTNQPERKEKKKRKRHTDEQRKKSVGLTTVERTIVGDLWPERPWKRLDYRWVHSDVCSVQFPRDVSTCVMPPFAAPLFIERVAKEVGERIIIILLRLLLSLFVCVCILYNMLREKGAVDHTDGQKVLVNCFRAPASRYQRENSKKTSLEKEIEFFLILILCKKGKIEIKKEGPVAIIFFYFLFYVYVSFVPASSRIS